MTRRVFHICLLYIILLSCKDNKTCKRVTVTESKVQIDTTNLREYAELILENKVAPTDDELTFECIAGLYTKDQSDLEFFFQVFRVIVKKSDGALAEVMGQEIMNFLIFNPDFFLEQYSEFGIDEKNSFIEHMAYEFYFTEPDHIQEIDAFFKEINSRFKTSTEQKSNCLNSIKELTKTQTENIVNE